MNPNELSACGLLPVCRFPLESFSLEPGLGHADFLWPVGDRLTGARGEPLRARAGRARGVRTREPSGRGRRRDGCRGCLPLERCANQRWHPSFDKTRVREPLVIVSQQERAPAQDAQRGAGFARLGPMPAARQSRHRPSVRRYSEGEVGKPLRAASYGDRDSVELDPKKRTSYSRTGGSS